MLIWGRGYLIYLLSPNLQTRLWHCQLSYTSHAIVAQASKLVDRIKLGEILGPIDKSYSSNSKSDNNSAEDADTFTLIYKITEQNSEGVEKLCEIYIESKYTRIVKSKKITLTTRRL